MFMKTNLKPIRSLALAAMAIAAAGSVTGQTVITPALMAPPSAYNTSSTGMVLRAHQIFATRTPGDQNSLANIQKQLSGGFGANQATNGPLTGGLWSEQYLNHTHYPAFPAQGDADWFYFTAAALPFPGINVDTNQTAGFTSIAYEILTYLNLPAGTNILKVGCGDAYKIYIGAGDNPYSLAAATPFAFDGSRGYAPSTFTIDVQSAGVYPVRIIFGQGGDQVGGIQFYSTDGTFTNLINDPSPSGGVVLTSYQPAVLPIPAPTLAYVSLLAPEPGEAGVTPQPTVRVQFIDGTTTTVATNTIALNFDGVAVVPSITKTGSVTYVSYTVPGLLANLSLHTNRVVAQDSLGNVMSNQWTFTVGTFTVIPTSWAYAAGSGDATQPGFAGRIHQTRDGANGTPTILYGNNQIEGLLIDGATGLPYRNTVVTNGDPIIGLGWPGTRPADAGGGLGDARTFTETNVINYSISGTAVTDTGNFNSVNGQADALFPGLPGSIDDGFTNYINSGEIAVELVAFLELPAGLQQIGVYCNDGYQLAISPNNAKDLFRQELIKNEAVRAATESITSVYIQTNGLYSFRVIYRLYRDTVTDDLEWFSVNPANAARVLLNGTNAGAVKTFRALTVPTRSYVKTVSPVKDASGVLALTPISVVLVNATNITPVLKVNGNTVSYTATTNGNEVTLTHTPPVALSGTVNCEINYGGLTGLWSYTIQSGRKALFVTAGSTASGGDVPIVNRLATKFGLDVQVVAQGALAADVTSGLALTTNKVLIVVSSLVGGGTVAPWAQACIRSNITVPVMTWEQANGDDWAFTPGTTGPAVGGTSHLAISNGPSFLHAGFANGQVVSTHTGGAGGMSCSAAPGAILAGYFTNAANPSLVAVTNGFSVLNTLFNGGATPVTHASRKVFFGLVDNGSASFLNTNGMALFDASIDWLLRPILTRTNGPGAGQITLSWTGDAVLQTHTNLATPDWISAPSQANPQAVNTTEPQRYYRAKQNN